MTETSDAGAAIEKSNLRRWLVRLGVAALAFEIFYVVAANLFLQTGLIFRVINKRPERMLIQWTSAWTYLPGVVKVSGFTMRNQGKKDQIYLEVAEAHAVISLLKLPFKTIHVRKVNAADVDFRYRRRLDAVRAGNEGKDPPELPAGAEYYPEIPGLSNPPDLKPEELYPRKKNPPRPWALKLSGMKIRGPVRAAINEVAMVGEGMVGGGMTMKPKETITIHKAKVDFAPLKVEIGPEVVTKELEVRVNARFQPFPLKRPEVADIIGGISGLVAVRGEIGDRAAFASQITPGITVKGSGFVDTELKLKKGVLQSRSKFSLESSHFGVKLMALEFVGAAVVEGATTKVDRVPVTRAHIELAEYALHDPGDESVAVAGRGLTLDAEWSPLSFSQRSPASAAEVLIPRTEIHDVSVFNGLMPAQKQLSFQSGTGTVEAQLQVSDGGIAAGTLDLVAEDITLESSGVLHYGDLVVHTNLAEGDLPARRFNLSGTTIKVDDIVGAEDSKKQQKKLENWFCSIKVERGEVTFGRPLTVNGRFNIEMFDIRPIMALIKQLGKAPGWLFLVPNVKNVNGVVEVDVGGDHTTLDDVEITGKGLEVLGWMHLQKPNSNGRMFIKHGILAAGIAMDQGKAKIVLSKPRKWFDEEQASRPE